MKYFFAGQVWSGPALGVLVVGACLCVSCERNPQAVGGASDESGGQPDVVADAADVPSPGELDALPDGTEADVPACKGVLWFVDPTDDLGKPALNATVFNMKVLFNATRDLKVRLTCGPNPVPGAGIAFQRIDDTQNTCQLASGKLVTDGSGDAADMLTNVVQHVEKFQVKVSVDGDDSVDPIYFSVLVFGDTWPPLLVSFANYTGTYSMLNGAEVRLFKQAANGGPACADLGGVSDVAKLQAAITTPTIQLTATYPFDHLPNLDTELTQAYTIVGLASTGQGPIQAWACDDTHGKVEYGSQVHVELTLKDVPP